MKANQKFVSSDEAVSPVIGVILMVAITVVLAAVVFVLVSDLGDTGDAAEQASVTVQSNSPDTFTVLLVTEGKNAPYPTADVAISAGGDLCTGAVGDGSFAAGESISVSGDDTTGDAGCRDQFDGGDEVQVVVTIKGTVVFNGPVDVKA